MPLRYPARGGGPVPRAQSATPAAARPAEEQWSRPYPIGPYRVGSAALLLTLTGYLMLGALVVGLAGAVGQAGLLSGIAVVVAVCTVRTLRVGVWVSEAGLRRVGLCGTTTLAWATVGSVRTAQQPVRLLSLPLQVQGQALVIHRVDGGELPALLSDQSPDFLGRGERFDVAAYRIEEWAARRQRT